MKLLLDIPEHPPFFTKNLKVTRIPVCTFMAPLIVQASSLVMIISDVKKRYRFDKHLVKKKSNQLESYLHLLRLINTKKLNINLTAVVLRSFRFHRSPTNMPGDDHSRLREQVMLT